MPWARLHKTLSYMLSGPALSWLFVWRACGRAEVAIVVASVKASPDCFKYEGSAWEGGKGRTGWTGTHEPCRRSGSLALVCFTFPSDRFQSEQTGTGKANVCACLFSRRLSIASFSHPPLLCPPPYLKIPPSHTQPLFLRHTAHAGRALPACTADGTQPHVLPFSPPPPRPPAPACLVPGSSLSSQRQGRGDETKLVYSCCGLEREGEPREQGTTCHLCPPAYYKITH